MTAKHFASTALRAVRAGLVSTAIFQLAIGSAFAADQTQTDPPRDNATTTPIKHVIVIIGENRSFDHVFATYVPQNGQTVNNLLSEGIVNADGTPGPNFPLAEQKAATDTPPDDFLLSPTKSTYAQLPAPLNGGPTGGSYVKDDDLDVAVASENGLPLEYYGYLVTGGSGLTGKVPDTRITNVTALPPGPFQLTNLAGTFTYNSYAASPVHRFYQMWQQLDCSVANATSTNPSGCDAALFPWVETTVGAGSNGLPPAGELQHRVFA